jgi:hypothetical protein
VIADRTPILDRVRKLLNLSRDSSNEHEAALAAQRAAVLMERHEIHEAELRALDEAAHVRTPEPIDKAIATPNAGKRTAWHCALAHGVSKKLHCHYYTSAGAIIFFGRLSTIQGASYLLQYLIREVERLTKHAAPPRAGRAWHNAFKLGCAHRVATRLIAPPVVARHVADEVTEGAYIASDDEPSPSDGALVLIQKDREEVDAAFDTLVESWKVRGGRRSGGRLGTVTNVSAYAAGKGAGDRANLGGSARGALPRGQGVFKP